MPNAPRLTFAGATDIGRYRPNNEDSLAFRRAWPSGKRPGLLAVVCDGIGGRPGGEIASAVASELIADTFFEARENPVVGLHSAFQAANIAVIARGADPALKNLGTTAVAAYIRGPKAFIANVGDSRAYLEREGELIQITRDHTFAAEQVRLGLMSVAEAELHPHRNYLARSIGRASATPADIFPLDLQPGDRILLCSDGLSNFARPEEIGDIVRRHRPAEAVEHLIALANYRGGIDNITAVVLAYGAKPRARRSGVPPAAIAA